MPFNVKYLTQEETRRFFEAVKKTGSKRDKALFKVIYDYGLRVSETALLKVDHIDTKRRKIRIYRLKDGYAGEKPITSDTFRYLQAYLTEREKAGDYTQALFASKKKNPISRQRIYDLFRKYSSKAGIPEEKRHPHALRHSIGTHLIDAGQDIAYVQDHLGHRSITSTTIYAKITDRKREEAFRNMERSNQVVKMG